jgi:membrane fusion protein, copper/silver efflux system
VPTITGRFVKNKSQNCGFEIKTAKNRRKMLKSARKLSKVYKMRGGQDLQLMASRGLLILIVLGLASCSKPTSHFVAADADLWTCGMHPSVRSKTPGKCPICGMDLVPIVGQKTDASGSPNADQHARIQAVMRQSPGKKELSGEDDVLQFDPREFIVPVERQQQIGVTYAPVRRRNIRVDIRSVGTLEVDQAQIFECVTRVDGYIEELQVTSRGARVAVGQPLMTIYSPDLRAPEQELINLLKVQANGGAPAGSMDQLIALARRRLELLNVGASEISELERTGQPADRLVLRSPFDGVVSEAPMKVGMGVKPGDNLMSVLNLSRLWLWASFYENEIELLREGQTVTMTVPAFPNRSFEGKIGVISPTIDSVKRTATVRIDIPNPDGQLRPGMYANVVAKIDVGEGLTIPFDAVLPTGSRMLVFVDKGSGKLQPRFVQVGRQFVELAGPNQGRYYQVTGSLREGERVVGSANFLIDAEAQLQGAIRNFGEEETPNSAGSGGSVSIDGD